MSINKYLVTLVVCLLIASCSHRLSSKRTILFQEDHLSDWNILNGSAEFVLDKGILSSSAKMNTKNTFCASKKEYGDFILSFEVLVDSRINSGVQIRSHSRQDYYDGVVHGYQIEIDPSERAWSGGLYEESKRGWINNLEDNPKGRTAFKNGEWNHYRIEAISDSIRVWVNDVNTSNTIDDMESSGFIAFQMHSIDDASLVGAKVQWKNIEIAETNLDVLKQKADPTVPYKRYQNK